MGHPPKVFPLPLPSQFTEEKFGQAEKTELDAHFENLLARADSTKNWTERILRQTEVLLQPNPSEWVRGKRQVGTRPSSGPWVQGSKGPLSGGKARLHTGAESLG